MLGVIGFGLAAIVIFTFAWTSLRVYTSVSPYRRQAFAVAFCLLAAAMALWALAVAANDPLVTARMMLAADSLVIAGTAAMIMVVIGRTSLAAIALIGLIGALLLSYRVYVEPSTAYVQQGLLFFNLEGNSRLVVVGIFALVWLPIAMYFAGQAARDPLLAKRRLSFQLYFVALVAVFGIFVKARRPAAIIGLFVIIIVLFLAAILFNLALQAAQRKVSGPRHATKPARSSHRAK